jgi:vacuolar-type H+-ATPase subunit I/STV1
MDLVIVLRPDSKTKKLKAALQHLDEEFEKLVSYTNRLPEYNERIATMLRERAEMKETLRKIEERLERCEAKKE